MRIIFVRHGQPDYVRNCLTETGKLQARDTALRLRGEGIEAIYSSPFGRALETARAAADELGGMPVQILDFMHELYWGGKDGRPVFEGGSPWHAADEQVRRGGDLLSADWAEDPLFENNMVVEQAAQVARGIDEWLLTLGFARDGRYYRRVSQAETPGCVALFSHGGSSTAALARIFGLPFPYLCAILHMPFASLTVVRFTAKPGERVMPCLELAGDGRHVPYRQE